MINFLNNDNASATLTKRIVNAVLSRSCQCESPYMGIFPCGQCPNCLANRQRLWVYRIQSECEQSTESLGVCLTFTEDMLNNGYFLTSRKGHVVPIEIKGASTDYKTNEVRYYDIPHSNDKVEGNSLQYADFQNFLKRLRKIYEKTEVTIKYFVKGEYGGKGYRPHYHAILHFRDPQNQFVRMDHIKNVASAWFNACVKYRGEEYPNMAREENKGKKVKVNPILEIEDLDENCAKYCAKYTSKFSLAEVCPMALACPEFQHASIGYGMDYLEQMVDTMRQRIDALISGFYKGAYADENGQLKINEFREAFDYAVTFYGISKNDVVLGFRMPTYLKRRVMEGYWLYEKMQRREDDPRNYTDKTFKCPKKVIEKYGSNLIPRKRAYDFSKLSHLYQMTEVIKEIPLASLRAEQTLDRFCLTLDISNYYETDETMQEILCTATRLEHLAKENREHFLAIADRRRKGALKKRIEDEQKDIN